MKKFKLIALVYLILFSMNIIPGNAAGLAQICGVADGFRHSGGLGIAWLELTAGSAHSSAGGTKLDAP